MITYRTARESAVQLREAMFFFLFQVPSLLDYFFYMNLRFLWTFFSFTFIRKFSALFPLIFSNNNPLGNQKLFQHQHWNYNGQCVQFTVVIHWKFFLYYLPRALSCQIHFDHGELCPLHYDNLSGNGKINNSTPWFRCDTGQWDSFLLMFFWVWAKLGNNALVLS